ncbi:MAG: hypothetical protein IJW41_05285, partial [Oscillospiraceae bacterium]|nr:hypothetical protein [Oscillospiraceae bacterium]
CAALTVGVSRLTKRIQMLRRNIHFFNCMTSFFDSRLIFLDTGNITDAKVEKTGRHLQFWK